MGFFKKLNELSPALTLLVVTAGFAVTIGGIVWGAGRWSAQLEAVRDDVQGLHRTVETLQADVRSVQETLQADVRSVQETLQADVRSVQETLQADVRSVQETLPHMVSCMIDLQRFSRNLDAAGDARLPLPASCEHALVRTTPEQGD